MTNPISTIQRRDEKTTGSLEKLLTLLLVVLPPAATVVVAVGAIFWDGFVSWKDLAILGGFYLATALGVTVGYHRMFTHNAFEAHPIVRGVLLILGVWSLEGSPISWAAIHIKHHAYSDREEDPHSPVKGFFHAHVGWLFTAHRADPARYAKRQLQDPVGRFVSRTAVLWAFVGIALPFFIGGWPGLLWGVGVRLFLVHHVTWSVNSVCHTFGSRPFKTGEDRSTNNVWIGLLALGEGWHNNHHAFPRSAFHGLKWREIDASGYFIRFLGAIRLARNIYTVPREAVEARIAKQKQIRQPRKMARAA